MKSLIRLYSYCLAVLGIGFVSYKMMLPGIVSWHEVAMEFGVLATYFVVFSYLLLHVWGFFTRQNLISALYINAFLQIMLMCAVFFLRSSDVSIPEAATLLTGYFQGIMFVLLDWYTAACLIVGIFLLQLAMLAQAGYKNYIVLAVVAMLYYAIFMAATIVVTLCGISLL